MSPTLVTALIAGAVEIFKDKKARKENMSKPSTILSAVPALAGLESVMSVGAFPVSESPEAALYQLANALVFLGLFFWRKSQQSS